MARGKTHKASGAISGATLAAISGHRAIFTAIAFLCAASPKRTEAAVTTGDLETAQAYYRVTSSSIGFSTPQQIFSTTLDDVAAYLGYTGITGADLQELPPSVLMDPAQLLAPSTSARPGLHNLPKLIAALGGSSINSGDILATRFFAPKIVNISVPESVRPLGWRKLVRLKARQGSAALQNHITSGIILFNIFTAPGAVPFSPSDESVNTQVMLLADPSLVAKPDQDGLSAIYWLDFDVLSKGGRLTFSLNASFDANELPPSFKGVQPYYVPDGCVACHGQSSRHSMVNYLDTDHWFDRLDTDFPALKASGQPLLVDAGTNDATKPTYKAAFDVIRRFNEEADAQATRALPTHDEVLAAAKWLSVHASDYAHVEPMDRAIGPDPKWSAQIPGNADALGALNQYCFRCHGTIVFSVFSKHSVQAESLNLQLRLDANAAVGVRMPPDRDLPPDIRSLLLNLLK